MWLILVKLVWIWLAVGFICAVKLVYIDKTITRESLEDLYEKSTDANEKRAIILFSKKSNVLMIFTLLGLFALYLEVCITIRDVKKGIQKLKTQNKNNK